MVATLLLAEQPVPIIACVNNIPRSHEFLTKFQYALKCR